MSCLFVWFTGEASSLFPKHSTSIWIAWEELDERIVGGRLLFIRKKIRYFETFRYLDITIMVIHPIDEELLTCSKCHTYIPFLFVPVYLFVIIVVCFCRDVICFLVVVPDLLFVDLFYQIFENKTNTLIKGPGIWF